MKKKLILLAIPVVCLSLLALEIQGFPHDTDTNILRSYFLDVGQGDATLIHTPMNKWILVDAGPTPDGAKQRISSLLPSYGAKIDIFIMSHPHADHINGLEAIAKKYPIGAILYYPLENNTVQEEISEIASRYSIPMIAAKGSQDLQVDDYTFIDILTPEEIPEDKNVNNHSLVFMLHSLGHSILFSGDAEESEEHFLLKQALYLHAELLKGGHHGSNTSSSKDYVQAIQPKTVLYMNGKDNPFHHPSKETLELLTKMGIPYFNTSVHGTITAECTASIDPCSVKSEFSPT